MNCGAVHTAAPFEALHLTGRTWAPSCQSPVSRTRSVSSSRCSARCRSLQRQRDDVGFGPDTLRALDGEPAYRAEIRRDVLDERLVDDDHRKIAIPVLVFEIIFKELEVFGGGKSLVFHRRKELSRWFSMPLSGIPSLSANLTETIMNLALASCVMKKSSTSPLSSEVSKFLLLIPFALRMLSAKITFFAIFFLNFKVWICAFRPFGVCIYRKNRNEPHGGSRLLHYI